MLIDVVRPETYEELNDQLATQLGLATRIRAKAYAGLYQAVYEVSQGTSQFFSHKKAIAVIQGQTSSFEGLLGYYYKETYEVQIRSHLQIADVKEWVDSLNKDTCFVLFSEDHPVTGELYPFTEELDRLLNEKRIFAFRVSHARHFHVNDVIRPYSVRICSYAEVGAVGVFGERFRSPAIIAPRMNWKTESFLNDLQKCQQGRRQVPLLVERFEKEIATVATPYFSAKKDRLYDRAICVLPDVSAEAVAQRIFKRLAIPLEQGWTQLFTTNMCYWSSMNIFTHWWEPAPKLETLRGLLIVGPELLETKDFAKLLISSYEEMKEQQSWEV